MASPYKVTPSPIALRFGMPHPVTATATTLHQATATTTELDQVVAYASNISTTSSTICFLINTTIACIKPLNGRNGQEAFAFAGLTNAMTLKVRAGTAGWIRISSVDINRMPRSLT